MNGQHDARVPKTNRESQRPSTEPQYVETESQHADTESQRRHEAGGQHVPAAQAASEQQATTQVQQPAAGWGAPPSASPADAPPAMGWGISQPPGGWGAPASTGTSARGGSGAKSKPWSRKSGLMAAGAAAILAGGAGVGVYALTSSSAAADGTADGNAQGGLPGGAQGGFADGGMQAQGGPGNFAPDGLGAMGGGLSAAVHSEFVVLQDSAYVTKVEQLGTVTGVSSDSVTVKSADGFARTYSLGGDVVVSNQQQRRQQAGGTSTSQLSVSDIVAGAMVRIVAAKDSAGYVAESVQLVAATATGQTN
jgi:hypothetical protein